MRAMPRFRLLINGLMAVTIAVCLSGCAGTASTSASHNPPPSDPPPAPATAPAITTHPESVAATVGASATFTTAASGTAPLTYQWKKNGNSISGATSSSYTTPAAALADSGTSFTVVVSNSAGSATSNPAILTVNAAAPRSYSTKFLNTENPISEGGNWINGGGTGLDWANVRTTSGLAYGTQSGSAGFDDSTAVLKGPWNSDQMAQGIVHSVNQNGNISEEVELRLRTTITAHSITGYEFNFRALATGNTYVQIVRWNGTLGSFSLLAETVGPGIHDGDVIKATAVGNTLTAFVNGVQLVQTTDGSFMNGGPGIGFFNQFGAPEVDADYGLENFFASELSN